LACYDLDRFRDLVFEKGLCEADCVEEKVDRSLEKDDVALIRFGIEWIKNELFGDSREHHENTKEDLDGT
jgi:hypothetical protein